MYQRRAFVFAALSLFLTVSASADIIYDFTVNTSSIAGTTGSLDFNFNPGLLVTQSADLQILNFISDGTLAGSPSLTGDVAGTLPGNVTFDNGTAFNDYFEGFTYGSNLSFDVRLYGPAVNSPNGTATSGTTFAFSMFSDAAGTIPVLTTDLVDGFATTIDVNLDGTATVNNFSAQTTVAPPASAIPEPGSLTLLLTAFGIVFLRRRRAVR